MPPYRVRQVLGTQTLGAFFKMGFYSQCSCGKDRDGIDNIRIEKSVVYQALASAVRPFSFSGEKCGFLCALCGCANTGAL